MKKKILIIQDLNEKKSQNTTKKFTRPFTSKFLEVGELSKTKIVDLVSAAFFFSDKYRKKLINAKYPRDFVAIACSFCGYAKRHQRDILKKEVSFYGFHLVKHAIATEIMFMALDPYRMDVEALKIALKLGADYNATKDGLDPLSYLYSQQCPYKPSLKRSLSLSTRTDPYEKEREDFIRKKQIMINILKDPEIYLLFSGGF
jgi:hypothetical protein